jgi:hypothetical protein
MPIDFSKINLYRDSALKASQKIKVQVWDNESNKVTFLIIIAAILMALFAYNQFALRHYAISATHQKDKNQ